MHRTEMRKVEAAQSIQTIMESSTSKKHQFMRSANRQIENRVYSHCYLLVVQVLGFTVLTVAVNCSPSSTSAEQSRTMMSVILMLSHAILPQKTHFSYYIRSFMYFLRICGLFFIMFREVNISIRKITKPSSVSVQMQHCASAPRKYMAPAEHKRIPSRMTKGPILRMPANIYMVFITIMQSQSFSQHIDTSLRNYHQILLILY